MHIISIYAYQIVSRNPKDLATEFCLASVNDDMINDHYIAAGMPTCEDLGIKNRKTDKTAPKRKGKNKNKRKFKRGKKGKEKEKDDDRISGSSAYLSDINPVNYPGGVLASRHHPWQCSLKLQVRHNCDV